MQLSGRLNSPGNQSSKNKVTKQEYRTISNSKRNQCQEPKSEKRQYYIVNKEHQHNHEPIKIITEVN